MQALKSKNPLTESFLVQLDVDLEGSGIDVPKTGIKFRQNNAADEQQKCTTIYEMGKQGGGNNPMQRQSEDMGMDYQQTLYASDPQMDLSPDMANLDRISSRTNSSHPTPSNASNKGSSHTSYTPPSHDSHVYPTAPQTAMTASGPANSAFAENMNTFASFPHHPDSSNVDNAHILNMPASWDFSADGPHNTGTGRVGSGGTGFTPQASGGTGFTPGPSGTGYTPGPTGMTPIAMPDGTWQMPQMLEGNDWNMYQTWNNMQAQQQ